MALREATVSASAPRRTIASLRLTRIGRWTAGAAILLGLAVFATWPLVDHLDQLADIQDPAVNAWDLWWVKYAVLHLQDPWWTTHILAPDGSYLAFHALMPLAGFVLIPVTTILGAGLTVNVLGLLLPVASTLAARMLARQMGMRGLAAWVAGGVYGYSTIVVWRGLFHLNFGFALPLVPLCLLFAIRYDRLGATASAVLCGVLAGLILLIDPTMALFAGLAVAAYMAVALAAGRQWRRWARFLAWAAVAAILVGAPQLLMMARAATAGAYKPNNPALAATWVATETNVLTMLSPGNVRGIVPGNLAQLAYDHPRGEATPAYGWGALGLALCLLVLVFVLRRRSEIRGRFIAWGLLLFLGASVLALGPQLRLASYAHIPLYYNRYGAAVSPVMPYTWLTYIPFLADVRVPARFTMLGMLPLAMLAGAGFAQLRRAGPAGVALAAALVAFAVLESGYPITRETAAYSPSFEPLHRATFYAPVRADHSNSVVVDVPLGFFGATEGAGASPGTGQVDPMYWATQHGHPIAEGYVTRLTLARVQQLLAHPLYSSLISLQGGAPAAAFGAPGGPAGPAQAAADARRINARWVVVWPAANRRVLAYLQAVGYRPVHGDAGLLLYRLSAAPGPPPRLAAPPVAPGVLSATDQALLVADDHLLQSACEHPAASPPNAVQAAVASLVAMYRRSPTAVAPGPLFAGRPLRLIVADFAGLLNAHCAPALGAQLGRLTAG